MSTVEKTMATASSNSIVTSAIVSIALWASIVSLPLVLTHNDLYTKIFPAEYYETAPKDYWYNNSVYPSPVGLTLGILAVVVGQIFTLSYFCLWSQGHLGLSTTAIQKAGPPKYVLSTELVHHLAQPEGFVMLGGYLILTWMFGLMPSSYYSFSGGINWFHVGMQLLLQDGIQYAMHMLEHNLHPMLYKKSHKPHHRFTNPKLFDAFNGSPSDTFLMILVPLAITARLVPANVWSYMAFGSLYANWLTMIHSEYAHPWDPLFRLMGFGTSGDHHVHHKLFIYNFGHLFMYWDMALGTYKNPQRVSLFNDNI
jgi:sterol desaturase/sphingolipid hydroxylase (fatty acid hydroxylase superfamily)